VKVDISSLKQLDKFAQSFSQSVLAGDIIFLEGDLGSGKTTFTQLLLKHLGYEGRVKSPTYAIYESYKLSQFELFHMDLYRLSSPEELYYMAIEEIIDKQNVVIIEWPQKGKGVLPTATKLLTFSLINSSLRELNLDIA
jgi:tRNA threonylcarbamoyladenosine biosynthesis protein TsaE